MDNGVSGVTTAHAPWPAV